MAKDKTPSDVSKMIKDSNVKLIDFKFTDLLGTWQHFTTTLTEYNEEIFTDGLGFDGSSIRGWRVINASDMLVIPDPATAWLDIFNAEATLSLICTIVDPITREPYDRDPRGVAEKAEAYLKRTGIAIERQHHEVATAGQAEIDIRFAPLKRMGDSLQYYKYIIRNVAKKHNKTVTFMPKPLFADNGSGMHTHISLWNGDKPLFAGNGYAGLSDLALFFIGGILKHAPALTCLTNPTTNSYKRLVPGFEAPVNLAYSARNRSAAIRIPTYSEKPKAKRVEYRPPDAAANPYLAFSALLLAGLDGIQNRIDPGDPLDKNLYELPPEELAQVASVPDSLRGAIEALQADHSFLLRGDVFNEDFIANWIDMKQKEYDALRLRPHPYEFAMYYDV